MFFTRKQIALAYSKDRLTLERLYKQTEKLLCYHASFGDEVALSSTMQTHQLIEYALLYQLTPKFKKQKRKV